MIESKCDFGNWEEVPEIKIKPHKHPPWEMIRLAGTMIQVQSPCSLAFPACYVYIETS
jgi:hypothetical protein